MDATQRDKVRRFIGDKVMAQAVYSVLLNTFLKPSKNQDVHVLAASRLAVDYLKEGWLELERLRVDSENETKQDYNVGL